MAHSILKSFLRFPSSSSFSFTKSAATSLCYYYSFCRNYSGYLFVRNSKLREWLVIRTSMRDAKFTFLTNSSSSSSSCETDCGREYLMMSDNQLISQCEMDTFKASGPGGQHRNKRESAVRLKHLPTVIIAQGMQVLLDLIFALEGSVADAAKNLGLSTGALSQLILSDDSLRISVNELRATKGMKPLK